MKIFEYDICDGDKGIIIAKSYEKARQIFEENYPEADPDCYDYCDVEDKERYEYGALLSEICEYNGGEQLVCVVA